MGLNIPPIFQKKQKSVMRHAQFALTPLGKSKAEQFTTENPQAIVLDVVNDKSPCDIEEIAEEAKMSTSKASIILKTLIAKGYIRKVNEQS